VVVSAADNADFLDVVFDCRYVVLFKLNLKLKLCANILHCLTYIYTKLYNFSKLVNMVFHHSTGGRKNVSRYEVEVGLHMVRVGRLTPVPLESNHPGNGAGPGTSGSGRVRVHRIS
jgi:hypothetical protein